MSVRLTQHCVPVSVEFSMQSLPTGPYNSFQDFPIFAMQGVMSCSYQQASTLDVPALKWEAKEPASTFVAPERSGLGQSGVKSEDASLSKAEDTLTRVRSGEMLRPGCTGSFTISAMTLGGIR